MKYILILLLLMGSPVHSEPQFNESDISFAAGYVFASIYDISPTDSTSPQLNPGSWKLYLGLLAGLSVAIGKSYDPQSTPFRDIVMGGLGGIACTVIHF